MNRIRLSRGNLNSPSSFKKELNDYILTLRNEVLEQYNIDFDVEEMGDLLLSICRSNDFNVVSKIGNEMYLNEAQVKKWIDEKLIPNTLVLKLDDEDVIRLLIFCIEITYQMFSGGTRATVTQKGFRERRRTFESILVDQFVGKLGEIFVKKFLETNYGVNVELDWEISTQIEKYRNDIMNAKKKVSIKTSPTLSGAWAEADIGYDYGIMVKCSVPKQPILQFFIEACGFSRLLDFAEKKIPTNDELFRNYLGNIRDRIKEYRCEEVQTSLKGFICGYFKTSDFSPIKEGKELPYLGKVREERYLVPVSQLKWTKNDWEEFLKDIGLL
ncbi:MAG: hypothetical protein PWQ22_728 [Archaeoglobaceae archaeon]|nr:hypothetical protein [Archaeoglobaceae archaeon]